MRDVFPGYFRPTETELSALWASCVFAIDASVLLNLYRYSAPTRKALETSLESVEKRLFLPHQAAKEFLRNRLSVTADQAAEYEAASKTITGFVEMLSNDKRHPSIPPAELAPFKTVVESVKGALESQKKVLFDRLLKDEILDFLEKLFKGRTGPCLTESDEVLVKEGARRYAAFVPPGFRDAGKESESDPLRKYGDFVIWKQLIAKSIEAKKPLVFITDDKKDDWWLKQSGLAMGPRPELREEFLNETKREFWMYTVDRFLEYAAKATKTAVNATAVAEVKQISEATKSERERFTLKKIQRDDLVRRLIESEKWSREKGDGFVGLHSFVMNFLGNRGYDYETSFSEIERLATEGVLEIYLHRGPGHTTAVKAIRLLQTGQQNPGSL